MPWRTRCKENSRRKSPPAPKGLPKGWKAELDRRPEVNRYYYYRTDKPELRTWYKPVADLEQTEVTFAETTLASAALEFWQQETELHCQAPALKHSLMAATRDPVCESGTGSGSFVACADTEAWACEPRFDTDTEYIATKLAEHLGLCREVLVTSRPTPGREVLVHSYLQPRYLSGKRTFEGVLIGWLYREVHFCFPKYDASLGSSLAAECHFQFERRFQCWKQLRRERAAPRYADGSFQKGFRESPRELKARLEKGSLIPCVTTKPTASGILNEALCQASKSEALGNA
eukprot:Skav233892  [mRNA]  locus=scaffold435:192767:197261:- [translate_table: standard]